MTIRDLHEGDLDRVLEINEANVPAVGPLDLERLGFLVGECALAMAVESDDELVGFCLVLGSGSAYDSVNYRWFMERYDDALYLDRVAFDASAHRRGLGSALYDEVARRAGGAARLTLEVNIDPPNDQSLAFHARRGFEEVGRQMSKGIEVSLMQQVF